MLPIIKNLQSDFNLSDAHLRSSDLAEMGRLAKAQFQQLHPHVSEEIANMLAWCYTFDWK